MSEHTPAPWTIEGVGVGGHYKTINGARIVDCNGVCVATISRKADKPIDQKKADARLIAAAPELLTALRDIVKEIRAYQTPECDDEGAPGAAELKAADAAIAKATGIDDRSGRPE